MAESSDLIVKVGASIAGGILIAMQGMNLQTANTVRSEAERVETETSEELHSIRELLERFKDSQQRQKDMFETLKNIEAGHPAPSPTK
ncbi:MAG: hypothetical protein DMG76_23700 [Acidobacteria bacterium]|nr:MAG: hypothetical protein DMG76_23700 [Acidobacteriota bacterium]